jgi:hypothetical protein
MKKLFFLIVAVYSLDMCGANNLTLEDRIAINILFNLKNHSDDNSSKKKKPNTNGLWECEKCCQKFCSLRALCGHQRIH